MQASMIQIRRRLKNKKMKKVALFTKPDAQVVPINVPEKKKPSKKQTSDSWGNTVKVANVIAWYVNPAMYILFSVAYFMVGMTIR